MTKITLHPIAHVSSPVTERANARGARVASGVYFYEARHGDEVVRDKIMLVK